MRGAIFLGVIFLLASGCLSSSPALNGDDSTPAPVLGSAAPFVPSVCFAGGKCISVEVASTPDERATGLMHRTQLARDSGMIFIFDDSSLHPFWMKNTLIPLDMVWIDSSLMIVDIQGAVPCTSDPCVVYTPRAAGQYVLEVNAGKAAEWGLALGQSISFKRK